jgi:hypothetical protein
LASSSFVVGGAGTAADVGNALGNPDSDSSSGATIVGDPNQQVTDSLGVSSLDVNGGVTVTIP